MIPDRSPDSRRPEPPIESAYCPDCGRKATNLTIAEARDIYGYGRTTCLKCRLTNHARGRFTPVDPEPAGEAGPENHWDVG